ncbi:MAG: nucleoside 2-deoxyribosyltransferase [Candidatus Brocadiia bacterium]
MGGKKGVIIYLSAPVFTQVQRRWNRLLAAEVEKQIEGAKVILPQDFKFSAAFNRSEDFRELFHTCLDKIEDADLVIAVLDGPDADSGTSFEVGYACAREIPIIGIRTDYRKSQDLGVNLMLAQACSELLREMSFSEDLEQLVRDLTGKILVALRKIDKRE